MTDAVRTTLPLEYTTAQWAAAVAGSTLYVGAYYFVENAIYRALTISTYESVGAAAGGGISIASVEVDLGSSARNAGRVTLSDAAITATDTIMVSLAPGPYTGKGSTLSDEPEWMGPVNFVTKAHTGSATVYWTSPYKQRGVVRIYYWKA